MAIPNPVLPERWLPRWLVIIYTVLTVALIPWILILSYTLPTRHVFRHWDLAWVGFDMILFVALATTAYLVYRHSRWLILSATALSTLLVVDAWFDVLSAHPGTQLSLSALLAVGIELPLAAVSLWTASRAIIRLTRPEGSS